MQEIQGNIWDFYDQGYWCVITTNGDRKKNGDAIMGRGIALEAARRFPDLPRMQGQRLEYNGNKLSPFYDLHLFCFPTKWHWWEKSDLSLIAVSAFQLANYPEECYYPIKTPIYLVRPGCGNGELLWTDVRSVLERYLDHRFIVVEKV